MLNWQRGSPLGSERESAESSLSISSSRERLRERQSLERSLINNVLEPSTHAGEFQISKRQNCCERFVSPLRSTVAMGEQMPNINVVHSVWRRLKKAKIRDLQPIKDVKGGGAVRGTSKATTGDRGTAERTGNH